MLIFTQYMTSDTYVTRCAIFFSLQKLKRVTFREIFRHVGWVLCSIIITVDLLVYSING